MVTTTDVTLYREPVQLSQADIVGALTNNHRKKRLAPSVESIVNHLLPEVDDLFQPRLHYRIQSIEYVDKKALCLAGDNVQIKSSRICKTLSYCQEAVCFIGTIGGWLEERLAKVMSEGSLTEAYILDVIGSLAAESMVETFHKHLGEKYAAEEKGVTRRFSPGYCDWPLREQKTVFGLFADCPTGVTLTESFLMLPRKSISGVIGVARLREDKDVAGYNPCHDCPRTDCPARRE